MRDDFPGRDSRICVFERCGYLRREIGLVIWLVISQSLRPRQLVPRPRLFYATRPLQFTHETKRKIDLIDRWRIFLV